jgi:hypothetical protein
VSGPEVSGVTVTIAGEAIVVLPATVAEIVIGPEGTVAGALYNPLAEMVPKAALPPAAPFTAQETVAPAGAPGTVNCWVPAVVRLTVDGSIDNCAEWGGSDVEPCPPPQATHHRLKRVTKASGKHGIGKRVL